MTNKQAAATFLTLSGIVGISNSDAVKAKIKTWLSTVVNNPPIHQAAIVLGAVCNGTNTVTNIHRFGRLADGMSNVVAILGAINTFDLTDLAPQTAAALNEICDELKNPNIEGIPIHAEAEMETSTNDVAQKLFIKDSSVNKEYRMDNTVPKPKTWTIRGYLMSNPYAVPLESRLIIKPSLIAQRALLQWFMDSRKPVWYKTHDNRFYKVLITQFESQYTTQSLNSLSVSISLTEFKVLEVDSQISNVKILEEVVKL